MFKLFLECFLFMVVMAELLLIYIIFAQGVIMLRLFAKFLIYVFAVWCLVTSYTIWVITAESLNPFYLRELMTISLFMSGFIFAWFGYKEVQNVWYYWVNFNYATNGEFIAWLSSRSRNVFFGCCFFVLDSPQHTTQR